MDLFSFFSRKQSSRDVAKDRLKLLLIHDRINCSPDLLEMMKTDIIRVISNYMDIDEDELDIQIGQTKSEVVMVVASFVCKYSHQKCS